jgi:hypothetical protein
MVSSFIIIMFKVIILITIIIISTILYKELQRLLPGWGGAANHFSSAGGRAHTPWKVKWGYGGGF